MEVALYDEVIKDESADIIKAATEGSMDLYKLEDLKTGLFGPVFESYGDQHSIENCLRFLEDKYDRYRLWRVGSHTFGSAEVVAVTPTAVDWPSYPEYVEGWLAANRERKENLKIPYRDVPNKNRWSVFETLFRRFKREKSK